MDIINLSKRVPMQFLSMKDENMRLYTKAAVAAAS